MEPVRRGEGIMRFRYTIKELDEFSNKRMIKALITERLADLNPYAPLARRLTDLNKWVDENVEEDVEDAATSD